MLGDHVFPVVNQGYRYNINKIRHRIPHEGNQGNQQQLAAQQFFPGYGIGKQVPGVTGVKFPYHNPGDEHSGKYNKTHPVKNIAYQKQFLHRGKRKGSILRQRGIANQHDQSQAGKHNGKQGYQRARKLFFHKFQLH